MTPTPLWASGALALGLAHALTPLLTAKALITVKTTGLGALVEIAKVGLDVRADAPGVSVPLHVCMCCNGVNEQCCW